MRQCLYLDEVPHNLFGLKHSSRPLVSACIEERTCEQQGVGSVGMCLFVCCQRSVSGGVVRGFRALAGIWVRDLPLAFRSRIRHLQDR